MLFEKPIAAALALTIGASLIGTAEAGHRYRHYGYHHHNNGAGIAAAGIFGLAAGALLGSALSQPRYYGYSQPAPAYVAPSYGGAEPWTPEWYSYCSQRYRSFDPETGYFLGYDGNYHFCN